MQRRNYQILLVLTLEILQFNGFHYQYNSKQVKTIDVILGYADLHPASVIEYRCANNSFSQMLFYWLYNSEKQCDINGLRQHFISVITLAKVYCITTVGIHCCFVGVSKRKRIALINGFVGAGRKVDLMKITSLINCPYKKTI